MGRVKTQRTQRKTNPFFFALFPSLRDKILIFDTSIFEKLLDDEFDVILNLEKDIGICAFVSQLKSKKRFGFYFHSKSISA